MGLALLALTGCVGPVGRIGFDRDVIQTLAQDRAAWCIEVQFAQLFVFVQVVRVSYWRDNAENRPPSQMRDCSDSPLLARLQ